MQKLKQTLQNIKSVDLATMEAATARLDQLTKPKRSLGKLEKLAIKLTGIRSELYPSFKNKTHIVMAADHGVVEEGVSPCAREITTQMVTNFLNQGAAINVLAKQVGAELKIVDIGMVDDLEAEALITKKIKNGTNNLAKKRAMIKKEAILALEVGIEVVEDAIKSGAEVIGIGEMGIGNTTPSSAIIAAITGAPIAEIVGFGSGLDAAGVKNKIEVIKTALKLNKFDSDDGIDILAAVGGLEIAGMAGVILGAAANKVPVVMDGLISGAAALIAQKIEPEIVNYLIPSHISVEPGHKTIYKKLGLSPFLDLDMRLGEGTGAVLAMPFLDTSISILRDMATFAEAAVINPNA